MSAGPEGAPVRKPLSVSWREWLASDDWCAAGAPRAGCRADFDAIVVGSGYGGSVAALRLAQKGYRVLLLERGSEYLPGEFPNDFSLVPKFVRVNMPGEGLPVGRASGLVELHLGQGMVSVTGNGLGGGSLVNAGVVMQPDADVFAQPEWPAALRHAHEGGLQPFFARSRERLGVHAWDSSLPNGGTLRKTQALQRLGQQLHRAAGPLEVTIDPEKCKRCGDCASGCNVPGAKQSLDRTYLKEALDTGRVQVVTQAEVYRFEHATADGRADGPHTGWTVHVFATDAQQQFLATGQVFTDRQRAATGRQLTAPMLFVCAGTFGSTQLMQRSQALAGGTLAFSPALGTRVSGNGDSLSWLVNEPEPVGGVGLGERSRQAWEDAYPDGGRPGTKTPDLAAMVGPTITAAIDLRTRADNDAREPRPLPLQDRLLVEDAAVPHAIAQFFRELLATAGTLRQLDAWWFHAPRHADAADEDPLAASAGQAEHAQTLLVMGHDGSPARIVWLEGLDCSAAYLPDPAALPTYVRQETLFQRFGSRHVHNPLWQPMPRQAMDLMSGDKPPRSIVTVHPLGGCVMGDDPDGSVVDDRGQVWVREPGRGFIAADAMQLPGGGTQRTCFANEPRLYQGLYVLDGSIVPSSLGCNPLWTITALAERALDAIPDNPARTRELSACRGADRAPVAGPSAPVPVEAHLHEVLQLQAAEAVGGAVAGCFPEGNVAARLEASFHTRDILADLAAATHRMQVQARLWIGRSNPRVEATLVYRSEEGGTFDALPANASSAGPALFLRSLVEFALLLASSLGAFIVLLLAPWGRHWPAAAIALAVLVFVLPVLLLVLPFARTALTWFIERGAREVWERVVEGWKTRTWPQAPILALLKQFVHASETRTMVYRIPMRLDAAAANVKDAPAQVTLHATKTVMYRATIGQLWRWLRKPWTRTDEGTKVWQPLRPTLWEQVMDAHVRVVEGNAGPAAPALLAGVFHMGFENLTSSGLSSARRGIPGPITLGNTGDTTSGLLALAAYPLLFLRFACKTRLLDFRLPAYSGVPRPDQAPPEETCLRHANGRVPAELHWISVPRGSSSCDQRDESTAPLRLQLRRYRQRDPQGRPTAPELVDGQWMGERVVRARSVLLLHAFGQSGLTFTLKTVQENLAESFYKAGYEVWILEMRMSTRSGYAADPCSIDQIARHDVPGAVRHIVRTLTCENKARVRTRRVQVSAFAQCIGSAALWMAALSGELRHRRAQHVHDDANRPCLSMLSHAMFSQVHPWVVGGRVSQSKTWVPALLQAVWHRGTVPFAVRGAQRGIAMPFLDRVLGSMPAPPEEARRFEGHEDAAATCRRIRFIEAPLFQHANINDATFGAMNVLFGEANLRLFAHARRFIDRERLVDEDGVNCYVTDANLRRHLAFPVQLLHGAVNELFDVSSAQRSFAAGLRPTHAHWQALFCKGLDGNTGPLVIPGHGHLDPLIGFRAAELVFPRIVGFFDACLQEKVHAAQALPPHGWAVRSPRIGPFVGWLRQEADGPRVRVSFVVDDRERSDMRKPPRFRLRFRPPGARDYRTLAFPQDGWHLFDAGQPVPGDGDAPPAQRLAWADLPLGGVAVGATDWQVLTVHESWMDPGRLLPAPEVSDDDLDAWLAQFDAGPHDRGPVVPPLSDGGHDFGYRGSLFQVPAAALLSLSPGSDLRFAASCCRHPGLGIDRDRVEFTARRFLQRHRDAPVGFGLLLGDQIYADATAGLVDPTSPRERYHERHEQAFDRRALGRLLAAMPFYMTPDDHEWIDAYPAASPLAREAWPDWRPGSAFEQRQREVKGIADRAISAFQRLQGPLGTKAGPWYAFEHGCARFFVIDSRFARERNAPQIVDPAVLADLDAWLAAPDARQWLNVVACGSVVVPGLRLNGDPANPGPIDTWQYARGQREALLHMLVARVPQRFLLLSGDYHVSGAGLLALDDQGTVGATIVVPPLYAPMPYANAGPDMVHTAEADLLGGRLRFRPVEQGGFERGSGVAVLDVRRSPPGGFVIRYERDLRVWERGRQAKYRATLVLPPVAGPDDGGGESPLPTPAPTPSPVPETALSAPASAPASAGP